MQVAWLAQQQGPDGGCGRIRAVMPFMVAQQTPNNTMVSMKGVLYVCVSVPVDHVSACFLLTAEARSKRRPALETNAARRGKSVWLSHRDERLHRMGVSCQLMCVHSDVHALMCVHRAGLLLALLPRNGDAGRDNANKKSAGDIHRDFISLRPHFRPQVGRQFGGG